jgi:hypothetical protein
LRLAALNSTLFLLSNDDQIQINNEIVPNRERVFADPEDIPVFYDAIDRTVDACLDDLQPNGIPTHKSFGLKNQELGEPIQNLACTSKKVWKSSRL